MMIGPEKDKLDATEKLEKLARKTKDQEVVEVAVLRTGKAPTTASPPPTRTPDRCSRLRP